MAKKARGDGLRLSIGDIAGLSLTNSSSETTLFSHTISGGMMGTSRRLKFRIAARLTTGVLPPSITVRVKLGSATLAVANALLLSASLSNRPILIDGYIENREAANAQHVLVKLTQGGGVLVNHVPLSDEDWTVDTTQDQLFAVTAQFGTASNAATLTLKSALIEMDY